MAIQDIQKYIEANRNQYPLEVLLDNLRESGYPEAEIQAAVQSLGGVVPPVPLPTKKHRWLTIALVTLAVIFVGVLAYITLIGSLSSTPHRTRDPRRVSDIKQVQLALELYYDANGGKYPDQIDDLAKPNSCGVSSVCMISLPRDPVSGAPYHYEKWSDCSYYMSVPLEDPNNPILTYDANPGNSIYEVEVKPTATAGPCAPQSQQLLPNSSPVFPAPSPQGTKTPQNPFGR